MDFDVKELEKLKELVPYEILSPTPQEIIAEIERLNNIINELEIALSGMNYHYTLIDIKENSREYFEKQIVKYFYDMILELKGSDKE